MGAGCGPARTGAGPPHRPVGLGSAQPASHSRGSRSSLLSLNTYTCIHTYIYIHKGAHPPPL
ncbi:hypothetical protein HanIR_Chr07g0307811 [Helianthus annuus]|nr:hypothetical protein HanIR_Chr07g0307811 [Helianthus annuus]